MKKFICIIVIAVLSFTVMCCDKKAGTEGKVVDGGGTPKSIVKESEYINKEFGISFIIPKGLKLYTTADLMSQSQEIRNALADHPQGEWEEFYLVNPALIYLISVSKNVKIKINPEINPVIHITITRYISKRASLKGLKARAEKKPNKFPDYSNVSVTLITIGKEKNMNAVEHVFFARAGQVREIDFFHRGRGFVFTCVASADTFEKANQELFTPLLSSMDFL